jgi:gluconokinase
MRPILIIGVSGSGKSTIGRELAKALDGEFLDGDDFHPPENVAKMASGIPLTDDERNPWLNRLVDELSARRDCPAPVVLACSALKERYRKVFKSAFPNLQIVYLQGTYDLIEERMQKRSNHFMKAGMLKSQFAALEEPADAIRISIDQPTGSIIRELLGKLSG